MDNASNALIIAGVILIALVILSLGVYLVASYSQVGDAYSNNLESKELESFNNKFEVFRGRSDITPQEIYSLYTYCEQYKDKNGIETTITIGGGDIKDLATLEAKMRDKNMSISFDTSGTGKKVTYKAYKCENIEYTDGRVTKIVFKEVTYTKDYSNN